MQETSTTAPFVPAPRRVTMLRRGDRGRAVADIRSRLDQFGLTDRAGPAGVDDAGHAADPGRAAHDVFDDDLDRAVRAFQQRRGLSVDGLVGPTTWRTLEEAGWHLGDRVITHLPGNVMAGDDVVALQRRLLDLGFQVGRVDGRFGSATEQGVREFQRNVGVPADGTCGPATLKALARLAPMVRGGSPNAMRAQEHLRRQGPSLAGKVVVIDPSLATALLHLDDPRLVRRADAIGTDLARRIEGRLVATGVQAFLTNTGGSGEDAELARAEFANRAGAHLCVSVQVDGSANPGASGVSTYFYGSEAHGVASSVGERFAGLVLREIVARTGLRDLRSHAKTWDILRRTRMPAVRIDAGYVSNADDLARLEDPAVRDRFAEAVVVAVQRIYLDPDQDAATGVLRVGELRRSLREG